MNQFSGKDVIRDYDCIKESADYNLGNYMMRIVDTDDWIHVNDVDFIWCFPQRGDKHVPIDSDVFGEIGKKFVAINEIINN